MKNQYSQDEKKSHQSFKRFGFLISVVILGILLLIAINKDMKKQEQQQAEQIYIDIVDNFIIEIEVWNYIRYSRVQHPEIVFAQAKLESANFTSPLFEKSNNIFGMMFPLFRPTTAKGRVGMYANYECWKHSIHDYIIWQGIYGHNLSEKQYFNLLDSVYAEDSLYVKKLKYIINE